MTVGATDDMIAALTAHAESFRARQGQRPVEELRLSESQWRMLRDYAVKNGMMDDDMSGCVFGLPVVVTPDPPIKLRDMIRDRLVRTRRLREHPNWRS